MSFYLEITIGGLCVLVPEFDSAGQPKSLHVLMPQTPETGDHEHRPYLFYLKRYHEPTAGLVAPYEIDLTDKELDLSSLTSDIPLNLSLSSRVFDFEKAHTKRSVDRALLNWPGLPTDRLRSRMRVNTGAEIPDFILPGARWMHENVPVPMATAIVWKVGQVPGTELKLNVEPRPLKPIDEGTGAGPAIRLFLLHVPKKEKLQSIPVRLPGPSEIPEPPFEADHFHHVYPLLMPPDMGPNPWFVEYPDLTLSVHERERVKAPLLAADYGSELTCMMATGKPG